MRRALILAAVLSAVVTAPAGAATHCASKDLRYPFQKGGPKTFGIFKLKITGGSCGTAHSVAAAWKKSFEVAYKKPKSAGGFAFKTLPATAAQTFDEQGTKGSTIVTFSYVVPNG